MSARWDGQALLDKVRQAANRGVVRGTERVLATAVRLIQSGGKSGQVYVRRGVSHQASAPGEPPASDTGRLAQSGKTRYDMERVSGFVSFSTEYAEPLELGTEKMEPRPYLRPALGMNREAIVSDVQNEILQELR